jgi:hypothetical protein
MEFGKGILEPEDPQTNMVYAKINSDIISAKDFADKVKQKSKEDDISIKISVISPTVKIGLKFPRMHTGLKTGKHSILHRIRTTLKPYKIIFYPNV